MGNSETDELLLEFTRGFAFDERVRQQLNYEQMMALADVLLGWALHESSDRKRFAWLTGISEGLLAEANSLGPDWNPPEPEKLSFIGFIERLTLENRSRPF